MMKWFLMAMLALPCVAMAQDKPAEPTSPTTEGYRQALHKMHKGMDIPYTGDADQDFVAGMIAHHQGAVDMARVEMQYGKDSEIRKLAQGVISAQEKEIAFMQRWQVKHGQKHAAPTAD